MLGKANHLSWAVTSALNDISDLFREKLSDDRSQYLVDGEWRDFKIRKE